MKRKELGALGEKIAAEHLANLGYVIRGRNFRSREGEIDIIAEKDDFLHYCLKYGVKFSLGCC